jgi:Fe-S-cluster-containing dehydrogenase component
MPDWAMVIDLDRCTGCEACVVACRAENNIPVAGESECSKGRDPGWIRVERYLEGEYPNVRTRFIPVLCQQCGNAPCEPVCPVSATYHNPEGLNVQVYARCVGTRYCANNCPYSVRAFNFYRPAWEDPLQQQLNPDVPVRIGGVMEKCTFCLQRIVAARDRASEEGRSLRDGDVKPACAESCPAQAIVFGDGNDAGSRVSTLKKSPRAYRLLEDLGTEPKVTYLRREGGGQ